MESPRPRHATSTRELHHARHWDGQGWAHIDSVPGGPLWVSANEVWAVGDGVALHFSATGG
jgi:hypothetical protein